MDRASLEQLLGQSLSLAEIGRRFDRHEATVAYWLKKHGLRAANRHRHEARGGLGREELARLVGDGMSIAQIAAAVGRSKATVKHWLRRHGLSTHGALGRRARVGAAEARATGADTVAMDCRHHGTTTFVRDQRGYYLASDVALRRSRAGGARLSSYWSARQGEPAVYAVTAATWPRSTSTISTPRASDCKSTRAGRGWHSSNFVRRRASASCSVPTATRRWRPDSSPCRRSTGLPTIPLARPHAG